MKWRHEARSPDIPVPGIGEQAGTPQTPLAPPHLCSMLGKAPGFILWLWELFPWSFPSQTIPGFQQDTMAPGAIGRLGCSILEVVVEQTP